MAKPMRAYKVDQTGPNMASGGVHDGNEILRYHETGPRVARKTKGVPINPPRTCPMILTAITVFGELAKGRLLAIEVGAAASSLVVCIFVENDNLSTFKDLLKVRQMSVETRRRLLVRGGAKNNAKLEVFADCIICFPKS